MPHALAYLRNVAREGECLPVASARSSRATAGGWVPMRSATCACVLALQPQLKQPFAKTVGVRRAQVGTHSRHAPGEHDVPGGQGVRQSEDLLRHRVAVEIDRVVHGQNITNMLLAASQARLRHCSFTGLGRHQADAAGQQNQVGFHIR